MTSAFSSKLAASAVAVTVVAGGILSAEIDPPQLANGAAPAGPATLVTSSDANGAGEAPSASPNFPTNVELPLNSAVQPTLATQTSPAPEVPASPQPVLTTPQPVFPQPTPTISVPVVPTVPSPQLVQERPVHYQRTREETLIEIEYQRSMAQVMELKAEAKLIESKAMGASDEEHDSLVARSREIFAVAESREYQAEAARFAAQADLLEQRLEAFGAAIRPETTESAQGDTIKAGDRLTIRLAPDPRGVWGTREMTVSPEGNVTLPYVGEIPASGLTPGEFQQRLVDYYTVGNIFEDPTFELTHTRPLPPDVPNNTPSQFVDPSVAPGFERAIVEPLPIRPDLPTAPNAPTVRR